MRVFRTTLLLVALTLLLMFVGQALGRRRGMTMGLGFDVIMNAFAYVYSDKLALMSSGAKPVTREQVPRLYAVMERLAAKANLPVPKLYVVPEPAPNAFDTGRNPRHASVAVTQGLLELMSDDELEGVIAHELSHVRNYDILISSIAATIAGAVFHLSTMGRWAMIFGGYGGDRDERDGGGIAAMLMLILAPIAAMLLQLGLSRQREYSEDATGARMVGNPYGLISDLEKLGAYNKRIPTTAITPTTSSLCIVRPLFGGGSMATLLSTHPALPDRIARLREMTIVPQR